MAGDWIKMRKDLPWDPKTLTIANLTNLDADAVVGKLHRLWSWADTHTTDGNAVGVTDVWLDEYLRFTGFTSALCAVGWLMVEVGSVVFPNFTEHNGQTAKKRALTAKRVDGLRARSGAKNVTQDALPEKRREEKSINTPPTPQGESDDGFEAFWQQYPKKRGKHDAHAAWKKLKPSAVLKARIMEALRSHKDSHEWRREDGRFIPWPQKWLKHRRWEDELPLADAQPAEDIEAELRERRRHMGVES